MVTEATTYYDTTHVSAPKLREYRRKASVQEQRIEQYMRARPFAMFSPDHIQATVVPDAPLTSVRRAMTNLTKAGVLEKTDRQVTGTYGRPVYLWRYAPRSDPQQISLW